MATRKPLGVLLIPERHAVADDGVEAGGSGRVGAVVGEGPPLLPERTLNSAPSAGGVPSRAAKR